MKEFINIVSKIYVMKDNAKRFWNYLWNDDSLGSWLLNLAIAFIFIKFLIYPLLGFALGSDLPIVAVVSGSMEQKINEDPSGRFYMCGYSFMQKVDISRNEWWGFCGEWYENQYNITQAQFEDFPISKGLYVGDLVVLGGYNSLSVGDIIVFDGGRSVPIIHRIVDVYEEEGELFYATKGDNNPDIEARLGEDRLSESDIYGKAVLRVPYFGYFRLLLSQMIGF